jgi:hypothetical protein
MTESNNGNGKWAAEGLGPRQIKRVNDLLAKIRWEHNNYVSLKRQFDGVNFHEDRTTYNNLFGVNCRADLLEKVNALKAKYQGTITVANLKEPVINHHAIRKIEGIAKKQYDRYDSEASVTDIVTDLLHYCDSKGLDFEKCRKRAMNHYREERKGY